MPLTFRIAREGDFLPLERLVIDSFEPITWFKTLDERFGPLNGRGWRERWRRRWAVVFQSEIVLVGEAQGEIVACATGTIDLDTRLGYIDLLAVDNRRQGKGYGRQMLRGMLRHMREQGCVHANLDCLSDNGPGNCLYRSEGFEKVAESIRWFIKIPAEL